MAISEESRHHLYQHLDEVLGPEDATTLMEHLPPVGWADVATKRDLEMLELKFKADLANALRLQTFAVLGGFTAIATALTVVGRF